MITIHGVPKEEPLLDVVGSIGGLLDITVEKHQIADIHRIRTKIIQLSAPIVERFTSRLLRDLYLERRKICFFFTIVILK
jgi:molybdate-binding protein